ncbi:MAG TPA: VOC family protein [Nocardioidaceae bacterium]
MTGTPADPFSVLATPLVDVSPDPAFAHNLRGRLERALRLPEGVSMSDLEDVDEAAQDTAAPRPAAIPYLAASPARAAIDWYVDVLGARLVGDPIVMPDGRIGHSELAIDDGVLYLSDAHPELGVVAPTVGQHSVSLMLRVDDVDETLARAESAGARRDREPYDGYGQRNAWMIDPFGHRWGLWGPVTRA